MRRGRRRRSARSWDSGRTARIRTAARPGHGSTQRSTSTPATTTNSSPACSPIRPVASATPSGLHVVDATPVSIDIAWDAVSGDSTLYGYEVLRDGKLVARLTGTSYSDGDVTEGQTYSYSVRAVDTSFNRSPASAPVSATAQQRIVDVTFEVTVPSSTDGTGRTVHIAGTLSRLQGGLPDWNPGAVVLTRDDATHWHITLHGYEGTQLEYKYALGDWEHVEKDGACGEIPNRTLTLAYGASGTQTVSDTVLNWRNVSPCGN